ncbi:MAG: hypothetical protein WAL55_00005, partial [Candidatus Acidiferrales bacterium]
SWLGVSLAEFRFALPIEGLAVIYIDHREVARKLDDRAVTMAHIKEVDIEKLHVLTVPFSHR